MTAEERGNSWLAQDKKVFGPDEIDFVMSIEPKEVFTYTLESIEANPDDQDKWESSGFHRSFRLRMRLGNFCSTFETGGIDRQSCVKLLERAVVELKTQLEKPYVPLKESES